MIPNRCRLKFGGARVSTLWLLSLLLSSLTLVVALTSPGPVRADNAVTPAAALPTPDPSYVLSPDDQIEISVLGHPEFTAAVTVLPDGTFNYPGMGKIHAAGLTLDGLTQTVTTGLSKQLNTPQVTVFLRAGRQRKVSVLGGAARAPGQYDYKQGMHLLDLIAASGGAVSNPELAQATLVTNNGLDSVKIDLPQLLANADTEQNLPLAPGDVLFLTPRDAGVAQVQVVGEVNRPGAYDVTPDGTSLLSLLNLAGGATSKAILTQVQVMHAGEVSTYNLRPLMTTDLKDPVGKVRLVPGDVLLIPTNKTRVLALGEVRSPGIYALPDGEPLPLTVALAEVGGVTPDGDKKSVNLVHRTPEGKVTAVMVINTNDLVSGKKGVADIELQPNDILFVQTRNHPKSVGDILGSIGSVAFLGNLVHVF